MFFAVEWDLKVEEESLPGKLGWKFKIFLGLRTYIRVQILRMY